MRVCYGYSIVLLLKNKSGYTRLFHGLDCIFIILLKKHINTYALPNVRILHELI